MTKNDLISTPSVREKEICRQCCCTQCYKQEFCGRCETCSEGSRKKNECDRFEGAYNY
ncbi:MAG: hypothetical protein MR308_08545 [Lachnospiraceae bacterium]|nr:hypothetical protein [Lachnospiraceae bacterium]